MREPSLETLVSLMRLYKATETKSNTALRPQGARRISSLRAFRRARDGAKGRGSWERVRWPDTKFEVTSAKSDLRNEQQREKREESREKREERREKREERDRHDQDKRVEGRNGSVPEWRDGTEKGLSLRGKREESREKRAQREEEREQRQERRDHQSGG